MGKQWCAVPCPGGREMGEFDENKIYSTDTNDEVYKLGVAQNAKFNRNDIGYTLKSEVSNVITQFDTETTVAMKTHSTGHGGTVFFCGNRIDYCRRCCLCLHHDVFIPVLAH